MMVIEIWNVMSIFLHFLPFVLYATQVRNKKLVNSPLKVLLKNDTWIQFIIPEYFDVGICKYLLKISYQNGNNETLLQWTRQTDKAQLRI